MKKNYELVEVKVISLENDDVITASGEKKLLGENFDLGDMNTQPF